VRFIPLKLAIGTAILIAAAVPALADDVEPTPQLSSDSVRLSPEEREAAIEYGATRALREPPINGLAQKIHGEIGMEVSSNGGHALYGTATVPLGESSSATFSFLTSNGGHYRYR
jgi:hypothetical protein